MAKLAAIGHERDLLIRRKEPGPILGPSVGERGEVPGKRCLIAGELGYRQLFGMLSKREVQTTAGSRG